MSYFIRNGNTYSIAADEALDIQKVLPVGNYTVKYNEMVNKFFLEMVDSFPQVKKLYGDTVKNASRILNTFMDRPNSTGVMLNGEKGSGKTLLAKTLSIEGGLMGIPTIIINAAWSGDEFNKFLQDIEQPCIILFDEFEKVYDEEDQEKILTLLDGVFPSRKLFVLTCNDKWRVDQHMRNRPGRIFYMMDFKGLEEAFIREYCEDNLQEKQYIDKIVEIASLFDTFNFDMLKALVEEMNRYKETPQDAIKMLNAKPEYSDQVRYDVKMLVDGVEITNQSKPRLVDTVVRIRPLTDVFCVDWDEKPDDQDDTITVDGSSTYHRERFTPADIKKVDSANGRFVYVNDLGRTVILTRQKESSYNYLAV